MCSSDLRCTLAASFNGKICEITGIATPESINVAICCKSLIRTQLFQKSYIFRGRRPDDIHPRHLANWTANVPTPPVVPWIGYCFHTSVPAKTRTRFNPCRTAPPPAPGAVLARASRRPQPHNFPHTLAPNSSFYSLHFVIPLNTV